MRAIGKKTGDPKNEIYKFRGIGIDLGSTGLMTTYVIRNWLHRVFSVLKKEVN